MDDPSLRQRARGLCVQVVTLVVRAACTADMSQASFDDILMAIESAASTGQVGNTPVSISDYNRLNNESVLQDCCSTDKTAIAIFALATRGCLEDICWDRVVDGRILPTLGTLLALAVKAEWDLRNPVVPGLCVICMDVKATVGFLHADSVHLCACAPCARGQLRNERTCPMCRLVFERRVTVYES